MRKIMKVCFWSALALLALIGLAVILRLSSPRTLRLGSLVWEVSDDDPNCSLLYQGTNLVADGSIELYWHGDYVYGMCGDKVFVVNISSETNEVDWVEHGYKVDKKYGFKVEYHKLRTWYDVKQMGRNWREAPLPAVLTNFNASNSVFMRPMDR